MRDTAGQRDHGQELLVSPDTIRPSDLLQCSNSLLIVRSYTPRDILWLSPERTSTS